MLIKAFIAIRDDIKEKEEELKKYKATMKSKMDVIEKELLRRIDADKVKSIRSDHGTAFKTDKEFYNVEEWEDFLTFICDKCVAVLGNSFFPEVKTNGAFDDIVDKLHQEVPWHFFNKVISKTAAKDYLEENKVPPLGIKLTKETAISIRKS
jgi:flavorubredoxin